MAAADGLRRVPTSGMPVSGTRVVSEDSCGWFQGLVWLGLGSGARVVRVQVVRGARVVSDAHLVSEAHVISEAHVVSGARVVSGPHVISGVHVVSGTPGIKVKFKQYNVLGLGMSSSLTAGTSSRRRAGTNSSPTAAISSR